MAKLRMTPRTNKPGKPSRVSKVQTKTRKRVVLIPAIGKNI